MILLLRAAELGRNKFRHAAFLYEDLCNLLLELFRHLLKLTLAKNYTLCK